jgi:hypothetical protein
MAQLDKVHARINTPGKSRDKPEQVASLIQRAAHGTGPAVQHVGIDHGSFDILVSEQFLDGADIISGL